MNKPRRTARFTNRRKTQEQLAGSESLFRATFENAAVGIAHVAPDGTWLRVNECLCAITGYSRDELLAKNFQEITHPGDLDACLVHLRRIQNGETGSYQFEKRYLRKDGSVIWARQSVSAVRNPEGATQFFISVAEDISEQKRAQEALRVSEERYRSIVATALDAIVVIDEAGRIQSINPASEGLLGYTPAEVIGKNVSVLMPEPYRSGHDGYIAAYFKTGKAKIIGIGREVEAQRKDGSCFPAELAVTEWYSGGQRYFTGTLHDLTERKRFEEQIHLLMREVNHRAKNLLTLVYSVARRTAAATPGDFIQSFGERIQALAAGQDLLVKSDWQGVDLGELVRSQLAHFKDLIGTRIALKGSPLVVSARAAQTIGMALHELATNAGKYGALSTADGRVEISWSLGGGGGSGDGFAMDWRERGGPPVAPPDRQGFGSTVISRVVIESLDANVELSYPAAGLVWRIECPASEVVTGVHARS
jgi:PAS domain S-box-containing protein